MPFQAYYLNAEGVLQRHLSKEDIASAFSSKQGLLWVDISGTTKEDGSFLEHVFGFHHLAVEDCVSPEVRPPKVDDFEDHLFVIVHGVNHSNEKDIVETTELEIFLGTHFVVSAHNFPLYSVGAVQQLTEIDGRPMRRGADFLAHALIDTLIDNIIPTVDRMEEVAEEIEEEVIYDPRDSTLEAILKLKRSAIQLHRVMAPQRELMNRISRGDFPIISEKALIYYRDIYDHILHVEELNRSLQDRADNALTTYLSSMANRQNEAMKVLSAVAAIFLPLTLVAGIYGMNFDNMPELKWSWGYYVALGIMGIVAATAVGLLWAQRWITLGRRRQAPRVRPFAVGREKLLGYPGARHVDQ